MSNKQTSVEWLAQQLINAEPNALEWNKYLLQAKVMHRKEIITSNRDGVDMVVDKKDFISGEDYYNNTYNKNHIVDTNEMIDVSQQNDVREDDVENQVPDVRKMVDDVEKLAEKYPYGGREGSRRLAFIDGYNKAKETLFTEEQVKKAIFMAKDETLGIFRYSVKEILQSLKQHK